MNDNVIILGAGFSYDAGIPLLRDFVDRMEKLAAYGSIGGKKLSSEDAETLGRALKVRKELENYHARAAFDDRNVEDLLSILSFKRLAEKGAAGRGIEDFTKAMARTIELCCNVEHQGINDGKPAQVNETGSPIYREFWRALIAQVSTGAPFPTIITFNYDLVLERSLLQTLVGTTYSQFSNPLPFSTLTIDYRTKVFGNHFWDVQNVTYDPYGKRLPGTKLVSVSSRVEVDPRKKIEILKLHGSLNFPRRGSKEPPSNEIGAVLQSPDIQPPVFNKALGSGGESPWRRAMERLRAARHVVIVGYSLPTTDVYMQYFLKAALGPNSDLSKIVVYDPVLFREGSHGQALRQRFSDCLATQLQGRINFTPPLRVDPDKLTPGTTAHFVDTLRHSPEKILF